MTKIVIKKKDGGVAIIHPNLEIYGDGNNLKPFSEEVSLKKYLSEGHSYFLCSDDEIPSKLNLESRKQLYHDGDAIKIDSAWEVRIMPTALIKQKHHAKLDTKLDAELEKPSPDIVSLMKMQREKDASKNWTDEEWHLQALKNLDEKVQKGEPDKPVIRKKLQEKLYGI